MKSCTAAVTAVVTAAAKRLHFLSLVCAHTTRKITHALRGNFYKKRLNNEVCMHKSIEGIEVLSKLFI